MKTLITGAAGFIGRTLALRIEEYGDFGALTLLDRDSTGTAASATVVKADITDRMQMARAVENADIVIHLAGLPGGTSEADPSASRAINLDASLNLIDVLSHSSRKVRMIYASTIAVFGAPLPTHVDDHTPPQPSMTYGTHKLMVEFALADAIRRGALEGVALRLPGVLGRAAGASGLKSAFMSNVFSAIRDGIPIELPVPANATMWMLSARCCAEALIHSARIPLTGHVPPTIAIPALRASMEDLVAAIGNATRHPISEVTYKPDHAITEQFGRYPTLSTPTADALGFVHDGTLERLVDNVLEGMKR
jgi:nucleoside-diphosphate-sugar epimerase